MFSRLSAFGYPAKLILVFVLLNFSVLLMAGFGVYQSYFEAQKAAELTTSNLSLVLERNLTHIIQRVEIALNGLGDFYEKQCESEPEAIEQQIRHVLERMPEIEAIRITNAQGLLIHGTGVVADKKVSLADRPHFIQLKEQPELRLAISKPQKSRINDQWVLALAQRLSTKEGAFDGMIFATVTLDYISSLFSGLDLGPHGIVSLLNHDQQIIARYPSPEGFGLNIGDKYDEKLALAWLSAGKDKGNFHLPKALDGRAKMVAFRLVDGYPLFVAVALDEEDFLKEWWLLSWRLGLLVGIFLLGSVGAEVALYVAWRRQQQQQARLAQQKALYQDLVEEVPFFVVRYQPDGLINFSNRAFETAFGARLSELHSQNWLDLVHEAEERALLQQHLAALTPEAPMVQGLQCRLCSSTLGERWIQWGWRGFFDQAGRLLHIQALGEDISERKYQRDIQHTRLRLLEAAQTQSLQEFLVATLNETERITASQIGFCYFVETDQQSLRLMAWSSDTPGHYRYAETLDLRQEMQQGSRLAEVLRQRRAILFNDPQGLQPGQASEAIQVQRELLVPVVRQERLVAILRLANKPHPYRQGDLHAVSMLGDLAWDLVEKKRLEAELVELANTDALTGLDNRRHFLERLDDELERLKRFEIPLASVLMFDLDHFKQINDSLGHAAGDAVLRHCAKLMRESLRKIDTCGRLGGEEFCILLVGTDIAAALGFAERLREKVASTPCRYEGLSIPVTTSIGITKLSQQDTQANDVLARADLALYRAKSLGRNRTEVEILAEPEADGA